jgi:hypothetical protein
VAFLIYMTEKKARILMLKGMNSSLPFQNHDVWRRGLKIKSVYMVATKSILEKFSTACDFLQLNLECNDHIQ